ncbi:MAG: efflux RND transporter permease subunit [Methylovulum sp.]|uniref:efflux RND transporter permease subunit n=1 Tax=Methylovulum sp. TaxID=1916980 RepID=UPI0026199E40|nr:efflux RND transporter permease subunit [Methylovulum sp.]MDD2723321.1 efflux RND transporter permease subunit [Methylovulum sp.]MDD5125710.1 efflux RND transporter permease subunit [Methylovulum sp.]
MPFSAYFISRPVATTLLTLGMALAGALAFFQLPVAALPQVDFPSISVRATLPGASPETMASSVATPLERTLGHIAGITEMVSSSGFGSTEINLQFALDRDFDGASRDVQAAINAASSLLPGALPSRPSYRRNNPSDTPLMILALTSDVLDRPQLFDVASTVIAQKVSQIDGMGQVTVRGSSLPAVRIELNPDALAKYGVSFADVRAAIAATNVNRPKGTLEDDERHWQIAVNDQAQTAVDYLPLIITYQNGAPIRLTDVGKVMDSAENLGNSGFLDGKPGVMLALFKQDRGNVIETVAKVKAVLPYLQASLPPSVDLTVAMDRSEFIRSALHEVELTLMIAVVLVIAVVFVFLRNVRSAMIPMVTVPVSLIATFGLMHLAHFSLNLLSMMALTVATGFVVDDAIVVVENTNRHIGRGVAPKQAALLAIGEVGFTVLTMSLSLIAVFIPILLMDGIVGRLFREFGLTLSAAVLVSLWVSFTTTPMLCAHWLKPLSQKPDVEPDGAGGFNRILVAYDKSLAWALQNRRSVLVLLGLVVALNVHLYSIIPKGFFPEQDTGRLLGGIQGEQTISSRAMQDKLATIVGIIRKDPNVVSVFGSTEGDRANNGRLFVMLKPLSERGLSAAALMAKFRKQFADLPGVSVYLRPAQELRIGGRPSPATYEYALQADDLDELKIWTPKIVKTLQLLPELTDVNTDQQDKGQQVSLQIDKAAAARFGVSQTLIDSTLNDAFGQRQVSVVYMPFNQYHVVMEASPEYAQNPEALNRIYLSVPSGVAQPTGAKVPLSAVSSYQLGNRALSVNHQDQFPTATISFNLAPGVSLSKARAAIHEALDTLGVPSSVHGSFQGSAKEFEKTLANQPWLVLSAIVAIYIVLGILYESYIHPLTILSTLPSAGVGAILALWLFGTEFSIIALIGVILLIGIVQKNAIMMIDFAITAERNSGISAEAAIREACHLRFRPILMTTFGALLAAIPLAFGSGYGSELLQPLGIAIIGGLVTSQLLTLYSTPVIYLYLDRCQSGWHTRKSRKTNILESL